MRGKSIAVLVIVILCLYLCGVRTEAAVNGGRSHNIELAGVGDVEDTNLYRITTLNVLAGGVAVTFSGWLLRKRKTS